MSLLEPRIPRCAGAVEVNITWAPEVQILLCATTRYRPASRAATVLVHTLPPEVASSEMTDESWPSSDSEDDSLRSPVGPGPGRGTFATYEKAHRARLAKTFVRLSA